MIAYRVPRASCRGSALSVSISPRQLHVACARTGEVWLHGELTLTLTRTRTLTLTLSERLEPLI